VSADGTFVVNGKYHVPGNTGFFTNEVPAPAETPKPAERAAVKSSIGFTWLFQSNGTVVRGGDGNLYGTTTGGDSFVWVRK
jgi:hypothetical protein